MRTDEERIQVAETIGAIQDTIRVHANALVHIHQLLYANIITLDLIYMDIVSELPEEKRREVLQNQFDESKTGAENDLAAMTRIRDYYSKRMRDCRKVIKQQTKEENKHE